MEQNPPGSIGASLPSPLGWKEAQIRHQTGICRIKEQIFLRNQKEIMEPPEREFSKEEIMSEFKILIKLH